MVTPRQKVRHCLSGQPAKFTDEQIEKYAEEFLEWLDDENNYWMNKWCLDNYINPDYMYQWAKSNEKFRSVYEYGKLRQEQRIVSGGMEKKYDTKMACMVLTNRHKWVMKQEQNLIITENPVQELLKKVTNKSKKLVKDE